MLICVEKYSLELRCNHANKAASNSSQVDIRSFLLKLVQSEEQKIKDDDDVSMLTVEQVNSLEVVMVIDQLRVISFDRFNMRFPSLAVYDD